MARGHRHQPPFPVRRVDQTRTNILLREFGIIIEDFLMRHAGGQPAQNVAHGNAQAPNAGLASALAGLNGDDALIAHAGTLPDELWRSNPALRLRRVHSPSLLRPLAHPSTIFRRETGNAARANALLWKTAETSASSQRNLRLRGEFRHFFLTADGRGWTQIRLPQVIQSAQNCFSAPPRPFPLSQLSTINHQL